MSLRHELAELFVEAWQLARSVEEAAAMYGCKPSTARGYASWLRSEGVPLKKFSPIPGQKSHDVAALVRLAESITADSLGNHKISRVNDSNAPCQFTSARIKLGQ